MYADNGEYSVILVVTDNDGTNDMDTVAVTIDNAVPSEVDSGIDQTVGEGDTVSFVGSFTDPGSGDTHTTEWDFGDGSSKVSDTLGPTHIYKENGVYTVTFTVIDDDGGVGTDTSLVTVNNVAPNAEAGGPYEGIVHESIKLTGNATDPGSDTLVYSWNFGDGSPPETGQTASHIYSTSGTYTATLTVADDDGGEGTDTAGVIVSPPIGYVDILMSVKTFKTWWQVTALVTIRDKDTSGLPVSRAGVNAHWSGVHNESVSRATRKNGDVSFKTGWNRTQGTVTFTVDVVEKDGENYVLSGEISDSVSGGSSGAASSVTAQNYPNPFNPDTWIPFAIDRDCAVTIRIYDITGKLIRTLDLGHLDAGVYIDKERAAYWDGLNSAGEPVASNIYFYTFSAGSYRTTRKMVIAK